MNTGNSKPNAGETSSQTDYAKARTGLLDSASKDTQSAQSTLTNVNRVQSILAKNPVTGPGSSSLAAIQTVWQSMTGEHAADAIESNASLRQLLGKELGQDQLNGMLEKLHGEGAQVRLGAQESGLILNALSANPDLSKGAMEQMLAWEKSDAQYNLDKAKTARAWVNAGRDPQQFEAAYGERFPRQTGVQTSLGSQPTRPGQGASGAVPTATGPNGQKLYLRNGQWVGQ
jgi:hypothetical protein